jgi:hypothetical protein
VLTASIIRAIMVEAASTFEESVNIYQTTRRSIPEDSYLQNFGSHLEESERGDGSIVLELFLGKAAVTL